MTTTYAPVPLHHLPRGLTVVPAEHRDEFTAAYDAFKELVTRHLTVDAAIEETALAAIWGELYRRHIRPLHEQVDAAQAMAQAARQQVSAYEVEARARAEADVAAQLRRRLQAERRDKTLREQARARDGDQCRYCGIEVSLGAGGAAVLDHVVPDLAAGVDNVVTACRPCRRAKKGRTPEAAGMSLRLPPTTPHVIAQREEPMKEPTITITDDAQSQTADQGDARAEAGKVRLRITYPDHVVDVDWIGVQEEPTPDELAEMINQLLPADPSSIAVIDARAAADTAMVARLRAAPMLPWWGKDRQFSISADDVSRTVFFDLAGVGGRVMPFDEAEQALLAGLAAIWRDRGWIPASE